MYCAKSEVSRGPYGSAKDVEIQVREQRRMFHQEIRLSVKQTRDARLVKTNVKSNNKNSYRISGG